MEGRRQALRENRRLRQMTARHERPNLEVFVEGLRADVMGQERPAPAALDPSVVAAPHHGPFHPDRSAEETAKATEAQQRKEDFWSRVLRPGEERKVGGGNRRPF
jgi:hypothetical protein